MHTPSDDHAQRGLASISNARIDLLAGGFDLLHPSANECSGFTNWNDLRTDSHRLRQRVQLMKNLVAAAPVSSALLLLVGCQSKRDTCAQLGALPYLTDEQLSEYWKRLGLERSMPEANTTHRERVISEVRDQKIRAIE